VLYQVVNMLSADILSILCGQKLAAVKTLAMIKGEVVRARAPPKSWLPHVHSALNPSFAKKALTHRLAVPPLPKGEGFYSI
jgi:hypothetical protein